MTGDERSQAGVQITRRRTDGIIETTVAGRISPDMVREWSKEFARLGGSPVWLFDAEAAKSYHPDAVPLAGELFKASQAHGMKTIVAVMSSRVVRMGASIVRMISGTDLRIVDSMAHAEATLRELM